MSDLITTNGSDHTAPRVLPVPGYMPSSDPSDAAPAPVAPKPVKRTARKAAAKPANGSASGAAKASRKVMVAATSIAALKAHLTRQRQIAAGSKPGSATHTAALAAVAEREAALAKMGVKPGTESAHKDAGIKARITRVQQQLKDALPRSDYRRKLVSQLESLRSKLPIAA
jgi:hypothetical protein